MDQTVEVAKQFPDVMFEHCTGYKHADNVGTYNSRFHQGRAVEGTIAGLMSKSGTSAISALTRCRKWCSGVNSFTLAAQAVNPKIKTRLIMINSWFDPAKEAAAVQTLINLGCDVVAQHTDSPAGLQAAKQRKVWCFGKARTCRASRRRRKRPAIEDIWGPYYISRAKAMLDGRWKPDDAWWGFKEGTVVMSPYNKAMPDNVKAAADKIIAGWKDGSLRCLHRPDLGPGWQGARRQGPAHGRQRPRRHRLVRQGRAELSSVRRKQKGVREDALFRFQRRRASR